MSKIIYLILILIIIPLFRLINQAIKERAESKRIAEITKKHSLMEIREIGEWELKLRLRIAEQKILFKRGDITEAQYVRRLEGILKNRNNILEKYNVTEEEMQNYYTMVKN